MAQNGSPNPIGQYSKPRDRFRNDSGEWIPAFAVLKIIGTEGALAKHELTAQKPDNTSVGGTFRINMDSPVPELGAGTLRTDEYGMWALYDPDLDEEEEEVSPEIGSEWGPTNDWKLHSQGTGFEIVGGAEEFTALDEDDTPVTYHRVRVKTTSAGGGTKIKFGEVTTEITAATPWTALGTGYVQKYKDDLTTDGSPVVMESNWPIALPIGSIVAFDDSSYDPPRIINATCVPAEP